MFADHPVEHIRRQVTDRLDVVVLIDQGGFQIDPGDVPGGSHGKIGGDLVANVRSRRVELNDDIFIGRGKVRPGFEVRP
jgi:hypothetical protein